MASRATLRRRKLRKFKSTQRVIVKSYGSLPSSIMLTPETIAQLQRQLAYDGQRVALEEQQRREAMQEQLQKISQIQHNQRHDQQYYTPTKYWGGYESPYNKAQ